jgi:hypothetical protein
MTALAVYFSGLGVAIAVCAAFMAKGLGRNLYLWGSLTLLLGLVFWPLGYAPVALLYVIGPRSGAAPSGMPRMVFHHLNTALLGGLAGLTGGYLLRPTFLDMPVPLSVMWSPAPEDAGLAETMLIHMTASGTIGAIVGLAIGIVLRKHAKK